MKMMKKFSTNVQMISAEAPVLFAKAAEIFIHELTMRAWIHTEVGSLLIFNNNYLHITRLGGGIKVNESYRGRYRFCN
jgi:hypothetical protein